MRALNSFAERYAALHESDLQTLAGDLDSLVPEARWALRAEMMRRNLSVDGFERNENTSAANMGSIRGWLLVYCIGAVFIAPIWAISELIAAPTPVLVLLLPTDILLSIGSGVFVWRRNPNRLRWVRWRFLYIFFLFGLQLLLLATNVANMDPEIAGQAFARVGIGFLVASLWWKYFRESQRVYRVFGQNIEGLRLGRQ